MRGRRSMRLDPETSTRETPRRRASADHRRRDRSVTVAGDIRRHQTTPYGPGGRCDLRFRGSVLVEGLSFSAWEADVLPLNYTRVGAWIVAAVPEDGQAQHG